jgi:hypothetical protein
MVGCFFTGELKDYFFFAWLPAINVVGNAGHPTLSVQNTLELLVLVHRAGQI